MTKLRKKSLRIFNIRIYSYLSVVSGATDGIGKAYIFELSRRGLRKFMLIGRNEKKLERMKQEMGTL
jgi:short-subunit dehydrogenase